MTRRQVTRPDRVAAERDRCDLALATALGVVDRLYRFPDGAPPASAITAEDRERLQVDYYAAVDGVARILARMYGR